MKSQPPRGSQPPAAAPPRAPEGIADAPPNAAAIPPVVRLQQLEEENAQLRDDLLHAAADLENFRKRSQRELDQVRQFGIERLLRDLLPVVDNLQRALQAAAQAGRASEPAGPLLEGVQMVAKQFLDVLAAQGVQGFDALKLPFDPERHEAVSRQPTAEAPPDTVIAEVQRGYLLHGRLLRAAQVVVAVAPH